MYTVFTENGWKKDRSYTVTLMIEPVFMRATRQGANFIVVLIGLVIIFKKQITTLLQNIFKEINSQSKEVY